jgi:hypothetical protein
MPDQIERKRLKKKMLDRWENEGGRVAPDPVTANQSTPETPRENESAPAPTSKKSSRTNSFSSRKKPTSP